MPEHTEHPTTTEPMAAAEPAMAAEPMAADPWRRHSRRLVYENAWIQVYHDELTRPDGQPGIYGVIHFRTHAVGVVPIDDQDRVLLVGQFRYTLGRYSWEIPEGGVPFDEDPLEGARRELREETGCTAATWRRIATFDLSNSVTDESGTLYLATDLIDGEADPDGTEDLRIRRVPFDQVMAMIDRGEITDGMSQIALERVARLRATEGRP
jgi:8-oxo-dGTP pyrophosphatase MutT (NUDIX family)